MKALDSVAPMISVPAGVLKEFMNVSSTVISEKENNLEMSNSVPISLPSSISSSVVISSASLPTSINSSVEIGTSKQSVLNNLPSSISLVSKDANEGSKELKEQNENESKESNNSILKLPPGISISGKDSTIASLTSLGNSITTISNGVTLSPAKLSGVSISPKTSNSNEKNGDTKSDSDNERSSSPPPTKKRRSTSPKPELSTNFLGLSSITLTPAIQNKSPISSRECTPSRDSSTNAEDESTKSIIQNNLGSSITISSVKKVASELPKNESSSNSQSRSPSPMASKESSNKDTESENSRDSLSNTVENALKTVTSSLINKENSQSKTTVPVSDANSSSGSTLSPSLKALLNSHSISLKSKVSSDKEDSSDVPSDSQQMSSETEDENSKNSSININSTDTARGNDEKSAANVATKRASDAQSPQSDAASEKKKIKLYRHQFKLVSIIVFFFKYRLQFLECF